VAVLLAVAAATLLALAAPWPAAAAVALAALLVVRERKAFLLLAGSTIAINAAVLWLVGGGLEQGAVGGLRMAAAMGASLAALSRVGAARLAEGLRLPPRATAWVAAVLLAAHDVRTDFERLRLARTLEGAWPRGRLARAREAARLLPALTVAAHRRAAIRRDALRLAGHDTPARFVPIVTVAALATAGRLALLALPNVKLTYVVVFLGGLLWGPLVGATGGALAMLMTDLMLSGLYPPGLVNVPAMALLGLAGGALRRVDWSGLAGALLAASAGLASMLLFSAASDAATWLLLYRETPAALGALVLAGLAFNVVPALANALLFAFSVGPCVRAHDALRQASRPSPAPSTPGAPEPSSPPAPPAA